MLPTATGCELVTATRKEDALLVRNAPLPKFRSGAVQGERWGDYVGQLSKLLRKYPLVLNSRIS